MAVSRRLGAKEAEKLESAGMMRWLLTYADMITLLLALFIILFSISTINKVKLQRLVKDLGGGFAAPDALNQPPNGGQPQEKTTSLQAMQAQLESYIRSKNLEKKVETRLTKQGLVITLLTDKSLYDSGSADLKPESRGLLDAISKQLRYRVNGFRVEGNTDNVPISNGIFDSNWELSAARATNVVRYLVETDKLPADRAEIAGYGEFRPRYANDTEAHRAGNRRVDIVVLNPSANDISSPLAADAMAGDAKSSAPKQKGKP